MEENKEIQKHVKALGEWAKESDRRVAFVTVGELTDDGVKTTNALIGRTDRIARTLYGNARENSEIKQVLDLTAQMVKNPLLAAILIGKAIEEEGSEDKKSESSAMKSSLAELLITLAEKLKK